MVNILYVDGMIKVPFMNNNLQLSPNHTSSIIKYTLFFKISIYDAAKCLTLINKIDNSGYARLTHTKEDRMTS